jgi:ferredoxin
LLEASRRLQIAVDRDLCMGSGVCIAYAPDTFAHDEETKAVAQETEGASLDEIRAAVEGCPTGALTLIEREGE